MTILAPHFCTQQTVTLNDTNQSKYLTGWDFYPDEDLFPASRKKYRIHGKKNIPTSRPFPIFQMNKSNYFATTVINSFAVYHEDKQCKNEIIDVKINNNNCTKPCA